MHLSELALLSVLMKHCVLCLFVKVTKQRVAVTKSPDAREASCSSQGHSSTEQRLIPDVASHLPSHRSHVPVMSPQTPPTNDKSAPPGSATPQAKPTPGSGSRRKPRKLAVNFSAPKASE